MSLQRRLKLVRQCKPLFGRGGFQTSQRANRALAWAFGGLDRFDKKVIGVGFALVRPRRFSNVHWPLHIEFYRYNVKINYSYFSHYLAESHNALLKRNGFIDQTPPFFAMPVRPVWISYRISPLSAVTARKRPSLITWNTRLPAVVAVPPPMPPPPSMRHASF